MTSQKKYLIAILAGSLLLGGTGAALAFGGKGYDREGCDRDRPMRALQQLDNITDEQREQVRKLFDEQRESMRERRNAMQEERKAVREAIQSGASTEEIRALATKQGEQVTAMIMAKAELRRKMATILTDDQMKALQDSRSEWMGRHQRW